MRDGKRMGRWAAAACLALVLLGPACKTHPRDPEIPPVEKVEFQPLRFNSSLSIEKGDYPDLFSNESFAVWVGAEVATFKRAATIDQGGVVDAQLDIDARTIAESFVIIECHLESIFSDTSIAYDAVGFRQVTVYLETPEGKRVKPAQVSIGSPVEEEQRGALTLFRRTNLLVFPRRDLWVHRQTGKHLAPYTRLVLEGYDSKFYFEWPESPNMDPYQWVPTEKESRQLAVTGYRELYRRLQEFARRLN